MKVILTCLLMVVSNSSKSQSTINFIKNITPASDVYFISNIDNDVIVTDNYQSDFITLNVLVESDINQKTLSQLFKLGRYNISIKNNEILFDKIKNIIFINGVEIRENIIVEISIPYGVRVNFNQMLN